MDCQLEQFEEGLDRVNRALTYLTGVFLGRRGISMSRYRILRYLHSREEVNMSRMQAHLLVSGPTLTELVDGLVQDGLVQRVRDRGDRRMVFLRLTGTGREVYRDVLAFRCSCLREALEDGGGLNDVNGLLNGVYARLKRQIEEPAGYRGPDAERCDKDLGC
ncbi:MAG: MarR family transcriptional regulator [Peptococcaceae bacterium]|nr:MarR family transcriptional regulator [Peptococcaceae bacterium]